MRARVRRQPSLDRLSGGRAACDVALDSSQDGVGLFDRLELGPAVAPHLAVPTEIDVVIDTTLHAALRVEIERYRGREIDTAGDGLFATFDGPARAIRCACATRRAIAPPECPAQQRAGWLLPD
jgi:hypothetical protein